MFKKSLSINLAIFVLAIKFSILGSYAYSKELPVQTPVKVAAAEYITTKDDVYVGAILDFIITEDIIYDGITFIKKGTPAKGRVSFVEDNAMRGQPGEIVIKDFVTTTVDKSKIKLDGSMYDMGTNHANWVIPTAYIGAGYFLMIPLLALLLIKGGEAKIKIGHEQLLYTAEKINIDL